MTLRRLSVVVGSTLLCAFLVLGVVSLRASSRGGGAGPLPSQNGDVNCDGQLDISEAVHSLLYLFRNGPAPCAFAQSPEPCCGEQLALLGRVAMAVERGAPPRPADIVNVGNESTDLAPGLTTIYTVPQNKVLVVTDFINISDYRFAVVEVAGVGRGSSLDSGSGADLRCRA